MISLCNKLSDLQNESWDGRGEKKVGSGEAGMLKEWESGLQKVEEKMCSGIICVS